MSDDILYVMAVEHEFGPHLARRIRPLFTGVGPVEAAMVLGAELGRRRERGALPRLVVSLGSAGSRTLEQAEVYQVASVSYRDMDASPLGFARGCTPFLDLPATVELPLRLPGIPPARLSTGADIVTGSTYDRIDADMVDMETFAHLRCAMKFGIPLIGLRGISDGAEELRQFSDWTACLPVIDERLGFAVDRLQAALADGLLEQAASLPSIGSGNALTAVHDRPS